MSLVASTGCLSHLLIGLQLQFAWITHHCPQPDPHLSQGQMPLTGADIPCGSWSPLQGPIYLMGTDTPFRGWQPTRDWYPSQILLPLPRTLPDWFTLQGMRSLSRGQQPAGPCWGLTPTAGSPRQESQNPYGKPHTWGQTVLALEKAQHLVKSSQCECIPDNHQEVNTQIPLWTLWHQPLQVGGLV